jgi:hypothetical protein
MTRPLLHEHRYEHISIKAFVSISNNDVLLSPSHPRTRWLQNSVTPPLPVSTTRSVATPAASSTDVGMPRDSTLEL